MLDRLYPNLTGVAMNKKKRYVKITAFAYVPVFSSSTEIGDVIADNWQDIKRSDNLLNYEWVCCSKKEFNDNNSYFEPDMMPFTRYGASPYTIEGLVKMNWEEDLRADQVMTGAPAFAKAEMGSVRFKQIKSVLMTQTYDDGEYES